MHRSILRVVVAFAVSAAFLAGVAPPGAPGGAGPQPAAATAPGTRYLDRVFTGVTKSPETFDPSTRDWYNSPPYFDTGDLYVLTPDGDTATNRPLVVLLHGGHFATGTREAFTEGAHLPGQPVTDADELGLATELARRGYVVATISYRLTWASYLGSPCDPDLPTGSTAPACPTYVMGTAKNAAVADIKTAIAWLRSSGAAGTYGFDANNIIVGGHSAGAIAALDVVYSSTPGVTAGFALAGMMDDSLQQAGAPPVLLLHGAADGIIPVEEDREVVARANSLGNVAIHRAICNGSHNPSQEDSVREISNFIATSRGLAAGVRPHEETWFGATGGSGTFGGTNRQQFVGSTQFSAASGMSWRWLSTADGTYPNNRNAVGHASSSFEGTTGGVAGSNGVSLASNYSYTTTNGNYWLGVTNTPATEAFALTWPAATGLAPGIRYQLSADAIGQYASRTMTLTVTWYSGSTPIGTASTGALAVPAAANAAMLPAATAVTAPAGVTSAVVTASYSAPTGTDGWQAIDNVVLRPDLDNNDLGALADETAASNRVVGDFDGNGIDDVLVVGPTPNVPDPGSANAIDGCDQLGYGQADGTFKLGRPQVPFDATPAVGDFNGDGKADILWYGGGAAGGVLWLGKTVPATCEVNSALHYPWKQDNDGGSPPVGCYFDVAGTSPGITNTTWAPLVGDYNGDGYADVMLWPTGYGQSPVYYGSAAGTFTFAAGFWVWGNAYRPAIANVNGDAYDDLYLHSIVGTADATKPGRAGTTGLGYGGFSSGTLGTNADVPRVSNLDGDAYDDVVLVPASGASTTVTWVPGKSGTGWTFRAAVALTATAPGAARSFAGDFNGDGTGDLYLAAPGAGNDQLVYGLAGATAAAQLPFVAAPRDQANAWTRGVTGRFDAGSSTDLLW